MQLSVAVDQRLAFWGSSNLAFWKRDTILETIWYISLISIYTIQSAKSRDFWSHVWSNSAEGQLGAKISSVQALSFGRLESRKGKAWWLGVGVTLTWKRSPHIPPKTGWAAFFLLVASTECKTRNKVWQIFDPGAGGPCCTLISRYLDCVAVSSRWIANRLGGTDVFQRLHIYQSNMLHCTFRLPVEITSERFAFGFAWMTEATSCPSGKTSRRLCTLIFNSRAIRLETSTTTSYFWAFKRSNSIPSNPTQVKMTASSSRRKSSCTTRSLPPGVKTSQT